MVPLVDNICTIGINLITNGTTGKEIGAMVKMVMPLVPVVRILPTNGTIGRTPNTRIVKLGFTAVYTYLFLLFLLQNIDCGYSLEPPRRGGSYVYPQSIF